MVRQALNTLVAKTLMPFFIVISKEPKKLAPGASSYDPELFLLGCGLLGCGFLSSLFGRGLLGRGLFGGCHRAHLFSF